MHKIVFIGTAHKDHEKCNAQELYKILDDIKPEVVFLEALENTYTDYDQLLYKHWGQYHSKLEIEALQMYEQITSFTYLPILDFPMPQGFDTKSNIICNDSQIRGILDILIFNMGKHGFEFLNGNEILGLYRQLNKIGKAIVSEEIEKESCKAIDDYENCMLNNIYDYCINNEFQKGVFMCGAAHRESIMRKVEEYNSKSEKQLNWEFLTYDSKILSQSM